MPASDFSTGGADGHLESGEAAAQHRGEQRSGSGGGPASGPRLRVQPAAAAADHPAAGAGGRRHLQAAARAPGPKARDPHPAARRPGTPCGRGRSRRPRARRARAQAACPERGGRAYQTDRGGGVGQAAPGRPGADPAGPRRAVPHPPRGRLGALHRRRSRGQAEGVPRRRLGRARRAQHGRGPGRGEGGPPPGTRQGDRLAGRPRFVPAHRRWGLRGGRAPAHHGLEGDRRRAREDQVRGDEIMSTTHWDPRAGHLLSPDGKWFWDGAAQKWQQVPSHTDKPDKPEIPERPAPPAQPEEKAKPERGLSSFVGTVRSEDLEYGQTVLVWARWILIGTGLLLSFWSPTNLVTLQVQLAAIVALAFGNFYLHVQLLRGRPALDNVVYAASLADIGVVTALVLVQGGYQSPVFIFYFAAVVGISVAFPTWLTGAYTTFVVGMYGIVCLVTAPVEDFPAVFTRLLMIAAVAVCGNLFARSESKRRADAIRIHNETLDEIEQKGGNANVKPA